MTEASFTLRILSFNRAILWLLAQTLKGLRPLERLA